MSVRQAIASILQLFVIFAFFSASLFFICLAYLPRVRICTENLLLNHYSVCSSIGLGFFIAAFLLTIGFYGLNRGRYFRIKMGKNLTEIDSNVIRQTIEEHFKSRFSNRVRIIDVEIVRGAKMIISIAILRSLDKSGEELVEPVEKELIPLLRSRFGYLKSFDLIVEMRSNS